MVEELVRCGVDHTVTAPGSRSTPILAACARHPGMRMTRYVDERAAAFHALGWARAAGRPAMWLTTSGTAAANGLPAAVEASLDGVPLILATADRPPELRDTAANQAIEQAPLFGPYVRWRCDLPAPDPDVDPAFLLTAVDQAVYRATGPHPGPVHLNVMFRKPFEPAGQEDGPLDGPPRWTASREPFTRYAPHADAPDLSALSRALEAADRPMVVAGRLAPEAARAVAALARKTGWPVLADITSQLRLGPGSVLRHGHLLAPLADRLPMPDAVIEIGRPGVSGPVRALLRSCDPKVHAVIAGGPTRIDPDHRSTHRVQGGEAAILALAATARPRDPGWWAPWAETDGLVAHGLSRQFAAGALSEPAVAWHVSDLLPGGHGLWLANSMPIRDMNAFAASGEHPVRVGANRGASGIDGTLASAAGFCGALGKPVTVVSGDLAFLHDLNTLARLGDLPMTIVLVNNDGGGIFSFLPIAGHGDVFDPWFSAPHGLAFEAVARQFDLGYAAPDDIGEFRQAYAEAVHSDSCSIVEVTTDRDGNRAEHAALRDRVASWIPGS